ncbi:Gfo/Idh/MocA family protein [Cellulosimicrobium cellulans]|uniref:Oxidoreductase n=1 Tax=Cellulosimicrobium cellulans TaxID=1710 RepID=A0A4Y4E1A8_CELCE|nr:Gfo/Idh/MocA family oxidoreductase [Cellulosimicrobium cellulans]GED10737.1 oxidoreductase [Cellulosimicrobium cellulans]
MTNHAIIGCGRVAPNHVHGFGEVDGWSVSTVCDTVPGRAREFAAQHGVPVATDDVDQVLDDGAVTSVSITTGHGRHAELVEAALLAGKHVLVEKPFGLSPDTARALVDLARSRGLVLSSVSQHRYDPVVLAVREWIALGLLGEITFVTATLQARRTRDYYESSDWRGTHGGEGGSALINQGFHCLDTVRWLCGDLAPQAAVTRTVALGDVIETEDTLCGLLTTRGGAPVLLSVTVASSVEWRTRIEVVGTDGSVTFDLDHPGRLHFWSGSRELHVRAEAERDRRAVEEPVGVSYYGVSHNRQIADFCASVGSGHPMLVDVSDSVGTLESITGLYQHAGAGAAR